MTYLRTATLLVSVIANLSAAVPTETIYGIEVGPGEDKSDWYISRDADTIANLDTTPKGPNQFKAGTGTVVDSKPHGKVLWLGKDNTEALFKAKSAPIQLGGTSWVKCTGQFKVEAKNGAAAAPAAPIWKSQLKEKPGHIIIVHQYVGPVLKTVLRENIDNVIRAQGNWYFQSYTDGGGRYKVTVGRGGDVTNFGGIGTFLAGKEITPASVITVDDLGHGAHVDVGPFLSGFPAGPDDEGVMQPDTRKTVKFTGIGCMLAGKVNAHFSATSDHSVGDNIVPPEVAAGVGATLNDANGNPYVAVPAYTAQFQSYLKLDQPVVVALLHCFTADHGIKVVTLMADPKNPVTTPYPSVRDAFAAVLPSNVKVIGYTGCIKFPGNNPPTGIAVSE